MKKIILSLLITALFPMLSYSQITNSGDIFKTVEIFDQKVVFIKEIEPKLTDLSRSYLRLKEWGKINFAKDPFNSSVSFDDKEQKIKAKSRIELLLPENAKGIRETLIMKFSLDAFFVNGKCIVEITDITYINDVKKNGNSLSQKIKAENMISDAAISIEDVNKETRNNVRKNTLYFFNDLLNSLENTLNN